jgi:hypothetical protein
MPATMLKCCCLLAFVLAPAGAYALVGDPAAFRSGIGAAGDSLSPSLARYSHYWRRSIAPEDYQTHCGYGMRWQPFPTEHGYTYGCVPWR